MRLKLLPLLFFALAAVGRGQEETTTLSPDSESETETETESATETPELELGPRVSDEATTEAQKEEEKPKVCQHEFSGPEGIFTSENFPEDYKPLTNCTWNITVPEGQRVQLTFHLLNVEHNENCNFDWVKVFDTNGTLLKHVCGFLSQDLVVKSIGNKISAQFYTDGVVENKGFLASWLAIPGEDDSSAAEISDEKVRSYVLSFPQSFAVAEDAPPETVCLQLSNVDADGEVAVSLLSSKSIVEAKPLAEVKIKHTAGNGDVQCHKVALPSTVTDSNAIVRVQADFPSIKYKILSYKAVQALQAKPVLLIQTDKGDYRPKQEVKFRVLLLDSQLKPDAEAALKAVWIEDPTDARLAQWKDVKLKNGLAQLSIPLGDEPTLGTWKVKADLESAGVVEAAFTVSESVLPKFEVTIEGPEVILRDSEEESVKVCARYTHGSNVKGNANVTFFSTHQEGTWWRAPTTTVNIFKENNQLEQGCVNVKINSSELATLAEKTSDLQASVVVEEAFTGEQQNASWKGQVVFLPFKIDFVSSSTDHILGGFPYVGSLKTLRHDGSPMPDVRIHVCARLFTDLDNMRNFLTSSSFYSYDEDQIYGLANKLREIKSAEICNDYVTKADGSLHFSVPLNGDAVPTNVTKLLVHAVATDFPANETTKIQQPFNKLHVGLTHSNLTSALTVQSAGQPALKCADNSVTAFYSALPGEVLELSYFVTSGAAIVENGKETLTVKADDDVSAEYVGDAEIIRFDGNVSKDGEKKPVLAKKVISVNRPLNEEARVAGKIKLLVYIKDMKGRTLSATKEYTAEPCDSAVAVDWSKKQVTPAAKVSLKLKAAPKSYCGYNVVDKSVDLVSNPNKVTQLKLTELKEKLAESRIFKGANPQEDKCSNANLLFRSFEKLGLFVLSDALLQNAKCDSLIDVTQLGGKRQEVDEFIPHPVAFTAASFSPPVPEPISFDDPEVGGEVAPINNRVFAADRIDGLTTKASTVVDDYTIEKPTVELRNYFPETWLFDLVELGENGEHSLDLEAPHTITTWIADAVCSDLKTGLSVSNKAQLLVTQDFFADLLLPYSVKRGEVFPFNVSAFNSVDQKLPMKLTLKDSEDYSQEKSDSSFCLNSKDSHIETFKVTAKELHEVNITVEAAINAAAVPECGNPGQADGYKDTVQKSVQVKPEGFPVEKVHSEFLCREGEAADKEETVTMESLKLPEDLVEGSARAWISVTGDILAPALANLDGLVTLPTGCGEQNMITLVPNIYLLEYLNGTGRTEAKLEEQAQKYMKIGYERQNEHYRHSDGSYSVWGPSRDGTSQGSLWLTTFVVKAFAQASKFIPIDSRLLQKSINWILEKQSRKSGCFEPVGQLIHSSLAGPEQSLTASVLVALLEVEASPLDVIVDPAFVDTALRCIVENPANTSDIYTRSLVAYALTLRHEMNEVLTQAGGKGKKGFQRREAEPVESEGFNTFNLSRDALAELLTSANKSLAGKLFWTTDDDSTSRAVEVTAYNTLSLIMQEKLPEALQAIKWMTTHRNSNGGFVSTQDTMVAMQALSKYSVRISRQQNDLKLTSAFGTEEHKFELNEDNLLLVQKSKLETLAPEQANEVSFKVQGKGCFMVQTVLRCNVKESPDKKSFALTAEQNGEELKLCASYVGSKKSTDMVVIEAELLSGFVPVQLSLEALLNEIQDAPLKKYEVRDKEGSVALYFDNMSKKENCWKIELKREIKVEELKPAIVKIYDYYNDKDVFSTQYNLTA